MSSTPGARRQPDPRCPLRPGEPCTLCQLNVTGPHDCGLVYLMMADEDLRELRRAQLASSRTRTAGTGTAVQTASSCARQWG